MVRGIGKNISRIYLHSMFLNIIIHSDGVGGLQKISYGYYIWYGVQNISKYDIDIKVQPLITDAEMLNLDY